jgi:hypothetical protein
MQRCTRDSAPQQARACVAAPRRCWMCCHSSQQRSVAQVGQKPKNRKGSRRGGGRWPHHMHRSARHGHGSGGERAGRNTRTVQAHRLGTLTRSSARRHHYRRHACGPPRAAGMCTARARAWRMRTCSSFASLSAPLSSSSVTMDAWPLSAERCSGVQPNCANQQRSAHGAAQRREAGRRRAVGGRRAATRGATSGGATRANTPMVPPRTDGTRKCGCARAATTASLRRRRALPNPPRPSAAARGGRGGCTH